MRGIDTPVRKMRREIFKEIAQLAYHSDNLNDDVEALPYKIVNPETPIYRESIYREREIVREQIRLAMGLSLRPEDAPVHVTQGLEESNIDEKYYEPPMIQVIPSACNACPENEYCVTDRWSAAKKSVQRVSVFGAAMRQIVRKYVRRSYSEEGRRTHA